MARAMGRAPEPALALALALAACGGGSGDGGGGGGGGGVADAGGDGEPDPADGPRWEALIRGDRYPRLVFEVDAVPDRALRGGVFDDLVAGFAPLLDKPAGIEVTPDDTLAAAGDDAVWTIEELDALADDTFDLGVGAETVKIHVLLLDGGYDNGGAGTVLGVAWAHKNLALFVDRIEDTCGSILPPLLREQGCAAAQLAIATHEVGHVIGLVDNGVPMVAPHKDAEHGAHDASEDCVMYWAYDGTALVDTIAADLVAGGDGQLGFDDACLADVAAVRDR